jgi:ketosteroid isomerase-like protein
VNASNVRVVEAFSDPRTADAPARVRLADGRITLWREYFNSAVLLEALTSGALSGRNIESEH